MGFIETSYGSNPNLSQVNIDSNLNMGTYSVMAAGESLTGNLDMNNHDIVNVNKLLCNDFFSALSATASDNEKKVFVEDDFYPTQLNNWYLYWDKYLRIPSNIISNSTIRIKFYGVALGTHTVFYLYQYDPITQTRTSVGYKEYLSPTSEWMSLDITASGGELYTFGIYSRTDLNSHFEFQQGIKICYDAVAIVDAVWEVIEE